MPERIKAFWVELGKVGIGAGVEGVPRELERKTALRHLGQDIFKRFLAPQGPDLSLHDCFRQAEFVAA